MKSACSTCRDMALAQPRQIVPARMAALLCDTSVSAP